MWDLGNLTPSQILSIVYLLRDPELRKQTQVEYGSPFRIYLPFIENAHLRYKFLKMYEREIGAINQQYFKEVLYFI